MGATMAVGSNGARKSSNPGLAKPILRAASSGHLSPNLKPPTPARSLNGNSPAAGGFDKLLGLATRGKPVVGSRSDTVGPVVLGTPTIPNSPNNVERGAEVPAPNYDALPALRQIPPVGSEIAFKVLEMSDDYSPGLSEYKVGAVVAVGERGDVTVELKAGMKKRRRNGKFELNDEDGENDAEVGSAMETLRYNWAEMHEPKLLAASKD